MFLFNWASFELHSHFMHNSHFHEKNEHFYCKPRFFFLIQKCSKVAWMCGCFFAHIDESFCAWVSIWTVHFMQLKSFQNILSWKRLKFTISNCCGVRQLASKPTQKTFFFTFLGVMMDIENLKTRYKNTTSVRVSVQNRKQYMLNERHLLFWLNMVCRTLVGGGGKFLSRGAFLCWVADSIIGKKRHFAFLYSVADSIIAPRKRSAH